MTDPANPPAVNPEGVASTPSASPASAPSASPVSVPSASPAAATPEPAPALPGWRHVYSGKVRDLYIEDSAEDLTTASRALVVASDRVSAFDHILSPGIPGKGELLTTLSLWWFDQLEGIPNHLISDQVFEPGQDRGHKQRHGLIPDAVAGRAMLVKTLDMFPIECVVRGYLAGSGWLEYQNTHSVCGIPLPEGLGNGDRLPKPIFTPAFKAPLGHHDENISFERTVELVGAEAADSIRDLSLAVYDRASAVAAERGVILADTKFEFGRNRETGEITLADEVLTSDSSRYWDAAAYATGNRTDSFDKQIVRNWLAAHWDPAAKDAGAPPALPPEIVARTAARYRELLERLTH
ncbi:MAG: phosphoribosylaminoimidazolesuccinocarboxamide synthase [Microbacteriaceae bacterium]